jgi:hypothetical protein
MNHRLAQLRLWVHATTMPCIKSEREGKGGEQLLLQTDQYTKPSSALRLRVHASCLLLP